MAYLRYAKSVRRLLIYRERVRRADLSRRADSEVVKRDLMYREGPQKRDKGPNI